MAASNSNKHEGNNRRGGEHQNSHSSGSQITEAKETFATLFELSKLLNTGLDADSLALCVRLCERGMFIFIFPPEPRHKEFHYFSRSTS